MLQEIHLDFDLLVRLNSELFIVLKSFRRVPFAHGNQIVGFVCCFEHVLEMKHLLLCAWEDTRAQRMVYS